MPISKDPANRAKQLAALEAFKFPSRHDGWRTTKSMRINLPEDLADRFDKMTRDERSAIVIEAMGGEA